MRGFKRSSGFRNLRAAVIIARLMSFSPLGEAWFPSFCASSTTASRMLVSLLGILYNSDEAV